MGRQFFKQIIIFAVFISLVACHGDDDSKKSSPAATLQSAQPTPDLQANFDSIQSKVFTTSCATAGCHDSVTAQAGLILESNVSYASLINKPSSQNPQVLLVAPNDPENSLLIKKLEGDSSVGARMPLGASPLAAQDIATIRQWITDGAQNTTVNPPVPATPPVPIPPPAPVPAKVLSVTPPLADDLTAFPTFISITLDKKLDPNTVTEATAILRNSGGDGSFNEGNENIITPTELRVDTVASMRIDLNLSELEVVDDIYQVTLKGTGDSVIQDIDGLAIDGDGDATPGGDYTFTFGIQVPTVLEANLPSIQEKVFNVSCTTAGCHNSNDLAGGLNLEEGQSFLQLVGVVRSGDMATELRVEALNPDNSFLINKLQGTLDGIPNAGDPMPPTGMLPPETIQVIRDWITNGALEIPPEPVVLPIVESTIPTADAALDAVPAELRITLNQDIDPASISTSSVILESSGGNNVFDDGDDVAIAFASVQLDAADAKTIVVDSASVADEPETYRVTLLGTGDNTILNTAGDILDGDNDGTAGGDFTFQFTVTAAPPEPTLTPDLESIQAQVFTPNCALSGCHSGPTPQAGLSLATAAESYQNLVSVAALSAQATPGTLRIAPNDADNSFLIQRLEADPASQLVMPPDDRPKVPQEMIDVIRQWISSGAAPPPEPSP